GAGRAAGQAAVARLPGRLHHGTARAHLGPGRRYRPAGGAAARPGAPRVRDRPGDRPDDAPDGPPRPAAAPAGRRDRTDPSAGRPRPASVSRDHATWSRMITARWVRTC